MAAIFEIGLGISLLSIAAKKMYNKHKNKNESNIEINENEINENEDENINKSVNLDEVDIPIIPFKCRYCN